MSGPGPTCDTRRLQPMTRVAYTGGRNSPQLRPTSNFFVFFWAQNATFHVGGVNEVTRFDGVGSKKQKQKKADSVLMGCTLLPTASTIHLLYFFWLIIVYINMKVDV